MTAPKLEGFTPGPWKIDDADDLPLAVIEDNEDGEGIAELGERTSRNLANAALIAAAPRLLAEREEAVALLQKIADGSVMDQSKPYTHADTVQEYQKMARSFLGRIES